MTFSEIAETHADAPGHTPAQPSLPDARRTSGRANGNPGGSSLARSGGASDGAAPDRDGILGGIGRHVDLISSVVLVVAWSSGFIGARLGTEQAPVFTVLAWRFDLLAVLLVTACAIKGIRTSRGAVWRQVRLGLLNQVLYLGLVFTGIRAGVTPGIVALIAALQPLLVATVAGPLLGERTTRRQRAGLALGLAGVALVVGGDAFTGGSAPWWAYLCPLLGMLGMASGTVTERRWRPAESLLEVQAIQAGTSAVAFSGLAAATGDLAPPAEPAFWAAVGWLICLASLAGYGSYVLLARRQGATRASTLLYLSPPATMIWAYLMFGDTVTPIGLAGLAVTGCGVWLVLRRTGGAADRRTGGAPERR